MRKSIIPLLFLTFGIVASQRARSISSRRLRLPAGTPSIVDFNCPEDFGYYPHATECTKYYVCVFGGALLESCTGGLVYSHELQTCDWPRNVVCRHLSGSGSGVSTVRITDSRTQGSSSGVRPVTESLTPSVGSNVGRRLENSIRVSSQNPFTQDVSKSSNRFFGQPQVSRGRAPEEPLVQETTNRAQTINIFATTSRPSTSAPRVRTTTEDFSILLDDYDLASDYYFYDELDKLYDEYIALTPTTTQRPSRVSPNSRARQPTTSTSRGRGSSSSSSRGSPISSRGSSSSFGFSPATSAPLQLSLLSSDFSRGTARPSSSRKPSRTSSNVASTDSSTARRRKPIDLKPKFKPGAPKTIRNIWEFPPRRPNPIRPQPPFDTKATRCDPTVCKIPDCNCGGKEVPGGISPQEVPQIVLLTFDDSVNDLNRKLYVDLFERGRKNPNGCPISATFYVSHEWTDYSQVQNLYADGHEMASHSITHSFGEQFSTTKWAKEIAGQREILSAYGGVRMEDVRGMRAPFLSIGGNKMFKMLHEQNFTYDSSMPVYENKPPSWPYTMDYKLFHDCMIPPCPKNSYPGVWEVPMVMWTDLNGGRCSMADACTTPPDAERVYKMLIQNFERHYTSNRAPFGLYYHAAWFTKPHHKEGFIAFLDTITKMNDVWIITNWQALQWVRDPVPLSNINSYKPWGCDYPERPQKCKSSKVCNVWHKGAVRYMKTCQACPNGYPWTGNTGVPSPLNDN